MYYGSQYYCRGMNGPRHSTTHSKLAKRMRAVYTTAISQTKLVIIMLPAGGPGVDRLRRVSRGGDIPVGWTVRVIPALILLPIPVRKGALSESMPHPSSILNAREGQ